jgi:hypothetical protein
VRAAVGFAAIHLVFAAVGLCLLYALGLVSRRRDALAALGPAYLSGLAAVMLCLLLLLVLGVAVRLPVLGAVSAGLSVAFVCVRLVLARRGHAPIGRPPPAASPLERLVTRAAILALGLYFALGTSAFAKVPTEGNDDWAFWSFKALGLYQVDGAVRNGLFLNGALHPAHLDYPLLQPLLEALTFRAMGGIHLQEWHMSLWIVFAAFVWTGGYLLRTRGISMLVVLAPLGAIALSPYAAYLTTTGYADVTLACFVAAGALAIGLWLDGGRVEYALLGAVLLAAAANVKNEGQTAAAAILVAALVMLRIGRERRWRQWLVTAAIVVGGALPWIVWRSSEHLANNDVPPLGDSLDVGFLTGRLDRLGSAIAELFQQVAFQDRWLWVVPSFLALAVVAIATAAARRQAAFYLTAGLLMTLPVLWAYWTGKISIDSWLLHSANRVVVPLVFVSGVGAIHLLAPLLGPGALRPARPPGDGDRAAPAPPPTPSRE